MAELLTMEELEAGLEDIRRSPADAGVLEWIVMRPRIGERAVIEEGRLDLEHGLVGDNWRQRGKWSDKRRAPDPDAQLNVMNARVVALVARDRERWALAGDQLFVDFDLSTANLPPGSRLAVGETVIEVTARPHTGCHKFVARFGEDAATFVNSPLGRSLRLRGLNAHVVTPGLIRRGDLVRKLAP